MIRDPEDNKKILKHLGLWELKARPPPKAKQCHKSIERHIDYSDSQLPPSDDHLYVDVQYPDPFSD